MEEIKKLKLMLGGQAPFDPAVLANLAGGSSAGSSNSTQERTVYK
jgi:hypothetical protein